MAAAADAASGTRHRRLAREAACMALPNDTARTVRPATASRRQVVIMSSYARALRGCASCHRAKRARSSALTSSAWRRANHSLAWRSASSALGRWWMSAMTTARAGVRHPITSPHEDMRIAEAAPDVLLDGLGGDPQPLRDLLVGTGVEHPERERRPALRRLAFDRLPQQFLRLLRDQPLLG